jgi:hypothetical protein
MDSDPQKSSLPPGVSSESSDSFRPRVIFRDPYAALGSEKQPSPQIPSAPSYTAPSPPLPLGSPLSTEALIEPAPQHRRSSSRHRIFRVILVVIFLSVCAGTIWWWYTSQVGFDISQASLQRATTNKTQFVYPSTWHRVTESSYADPAASSPIARASITVRRATESTPGADISSNESLGVLRQTLRATLSDASIKSLIIDFVPCTEVRDAIASDDASLTSSSAGLAHISATCQIGSAIYHVQLRILIGKDSYIRYGVITATPESWQKNRASFTTLLQRIDQSNSVDDLT